jgi:hypothetical protein
MSGSKSPTIMLGSRFGKQLVICCTGSKRNTRGESRRFYSIQCDCGRTVEKTVRDIKNTNSCGCSRRGVVTHGHTVGKKNSPSYSAWANMRNRCGNPGCSNYKNYGGRGINICKRWEKFENFIADMGEKPNGLSLERINNNGNYEPGNCRWATDKEQRRNKRKNRLVEINGASKCLSQWCEELDLKYPNVSARLRRDWTPKQALSLETPPKWFVDMDRLVQLTGQNLSTMQIAKEMGFDYTTIWAAIKRLTSHPKSK